MRAHSKILRTVPNFPNYSFPTFGYPERVLRRAAESLIVFGPPIHLYDFTPPKSNTVHVSGIPDWATMKDIVSVFEEFGKLYSIELSVNFAKKELKTPFSNGWANVTFLSYDGAQKALFAHLLRRIPGRVKYKNMPLNLQFVLI